MPGRCRVDEVEAPISWLPVLERRDLYRHGTTGKPCLRTLRKLRTELDARHVESAARHRKCRLARGAADLEKPTPSFDSERARSRVERSPAEMPAAPRAERRRTSYGVYPPNLPAFAFVTRAVPVSTFFGTFLPLTAL